MSELPEWLDAFTELQTVDDPEWAAVANNVNEVVVPPEKYPWSLAVTSKERESALQEIPPAERSQSLVSERRVPDFGS